MGLLYVTKRSVNNFVNCVELTGDVLRCDFFGKYSMQIDSLIPGLCPEIPKEEVYYKFKRDLDGR